LNIKRWHVLWLFGICTLRPFGFGKFGKLYEEKSGSPASDCRRPSSIADNGFLALQKNFLFAQKLFASDAV
jgi:hypothetical protein